MGLSESQHGSERAEARRRLEDLVNEAEGLVVLAREEADRIAARTRAETTAKVQRLISQAEELRALSESQAAEILAEAEEERGNARRQADEILASARATHDEIVAGARRAEASPTPGAAPSDDARIEADRILRVARSEAEARSAEIVEQARRRAEAAEAEGRHRVESLRQTHRALQRQMREEEIAVKARITDLGERAAVLEGRYPASQPVGVPPPAAPSESREGAETGPQRRVEPNPASPPRVTRSPAEYPWSIREQMEDRAEDPDVLKGLRAIRRRT